MTFAPFKASTEYTRLKAQPTHSDVHANHHAYLFYLP
jgi:hypothetical protein